MTIASDDNLASFEGKYPKDLFNKSVISSDNRTLIGYIVKETDELIVVLSDSDPKSRFDIPKSEIAVTGSSVVISNTTDLSQYNVKRDTPLPSDKSERSSSEQIQEVVSEGDPRPVEETLPSQRQEQRSGSILGETIGNQEPASVSIPATKKRKKTTAATNTTTVVASSRSENYSKNLDKNQQTSSAVKLIPTIAESYPKDEQKEKESSFNESKSKMPVDTVTTAALEKEAIGVADKNQPITVQEDNTSSSSTALSTPSSQTTTTAGVVTEATLHLPQPEKIVIEEAEEIAAEKAVAKAEASSVLEDDMDLDQPQHRGNQGIKEALSNPRKQETINTEVIEKSSGNIEFSPPISSVEVPAVIEKSGLADNIDDIRKSKEEEKEPQEQQHISHDGKKEANYEYSHDETSQFASSIALWEYTMMKWIDISTELATNALKTAEYWFAQFWNPWADSTVESAERKNTEKSKVG